MSVPNFAHDFKVCVGSGEPLVRVDAADPDEAAEAVIKLCRPLGWAVLHWDAAKGLTLAGPDGRLVDVPPEMQLAAAGPVPPLRTVLNNLLARLEPAEGRAPAPSEKPIVLLARNFHLTYAQAPEQTAALLSHLTPAMEAGNWHLVVPLAPGVRLPDPLPEMFHTVARELPGADERVKILVEAFEDLEKRPPGEVAAIADQLSGLTPRQVKTVAAASRVAGRPYDLDFLSRRKLETVNREGLVAVMPPDGSFADLKGVDGVRDIVVPLLEGSKQGVGPDRERAKGILLFGPPGTGKTMITRAVGAATNRLAVAADPGLLMGGLVGDTERNTRKLFQMIKALAPVIVVMDEIGKVMPQNRPQGDSGVSSRLLGSFLKFMSECEDDVFWIFAGNEDVLDLNSAFLRAGRNDLKFYVGEPTPFARADIWKLYLRRYFRGDGEPEDPTKALLSAEDGDVARELCHGPERKLCPIDDDKWTGAEIQSCCRLAALMGCGLAKASTLISPVYKLDSQVMSKMYNHAKGIGAIDAATGRVVGDPAEIVNRPRRRTRAVSGSPLDN